MSITVDRRDVKRLIDAALVGAKRLDVKVEVKYYVQFSYVGSPEDDMAVQTIVDPYLGFNRGYARELVKNATERLDSEYDSANRGSLGTNDDKKPNVLNIPPATAVPEVPADGPKDYVMSLETGYYIAEVQEPIGEPAP